MKEFNEMVVESVRMELNTMKTRFLRSIKTAEDIAEMKEMEIERKFIMEMHMDMIEAEDIMKKVKEAKKEAEIIKKIKNMIEAVCLERMVVEIMRKEADVLNIEEIKESEEENTSSMASHSTSRTKHVSLLLTHTLSCFLYVYTLTLTHTHTHSHIKNLIYTWFYITSLR